MSVGRETTETVSLRLPPWERAWKEGGRDVARSNTAEAIWGGSQFSEPRAVRPARLLCLIPTLRCGGAERVMVTLLRHFDPAHIRPVLGVLDLKEAAFLPDIPPTVPVIPLQVRRLRYGLLPILRLIRSLRPQIVLTTLQSMNLVLGALRPLLPRGTRCLTRETTLVGPSVDAVRRAPIQRVFRRHLYPRLDRIICPSEAVFDDLVREGSLLPKQGVVIPNPVDIERIHQLSQESVSLGPFLQHRSSGYAGGLSLVAVGRLVSIKGLSLLLEAVARVRPGAVRLTLVGDGPQRAALQQQALDQGVSGVVHFAGYQSNPFPFLKAADALVSTSQVEGSPNAVIEALACGTPVLVAPGLGGTRALLVGVPGCQIAAERSPAALAALLENPGPLPRVPASFLTRHQASEVAAEYARILTQTSVP